MHGLTSRGLEWPAAGIATAEHDAARLAALARTLVDDGIAGGCDGPPACTLDRALPGLCALTRDLARLPAPPRAPHLPRPAPGAVTDAYVQALSGAGAVIYVCRRVVHPTGMCLFDRAGDADLCARVLVAAHGLGGPRDAAVMSPASPSRTMGWGRARGTC